ncbi:MAG: NAD(P)H-hydrate epimerase [Paracoccaceae bacterium]
MTVLLTAAQMRAIEKAAIDSGEVTGLELMERAGRGVVEAIFEEWPELADAPGGGAAPTPPRYLGKEEAGRRAVVLCGPGNNGGDGFVVARLLKERGWEVEVFLYGDAGKLPVDARVNYERWGEMGEVTPLDDHTDCLMDGQNNVRDGIDIFVDALFGTGLTRPLGGLLAIQDDLNAIRATFKNGRKPGGVVAVDIPSGMSSDTGNYPGYSLPNNPLDDCIVANLTVTFHKKKIGHEKAYGKAACGKTVVKNIGIGKWESADGVVK